MNSTVPRKAILAIAIVLLIIVGILVTVTRSPSRESDYFMLDWPVEDRLLPATNGESTEGAPQDIGVSQDDAYISWITAVLEWNENDENPPAMDTNQPDTFTIKMTTPWGDIIESQPENDGQIEISLEGIFIPAGTSYRSEKEAEGAEQNVIAKEERDKPWQITVTLTEIGPYTRPTGATDPLAADEGNTWTLRIICRTYSPTITKVDGNKAPDFSAKDMEGNDFQLSDHKGKVILLEFAHMCDCTAERNCAQFSELNELREEISDNQLTIVTIVFADNREVAEQAKDANGITWPYIYDSGSLPIMEKYKRYWSGSQGEFYDPTIVLIDKDFNVVASYHVTSIGGVMKADVLEDKIEQINTGTWSGFEGTIGGGSASYLGMFALGVLTSVSPCSIVLLVALLSYIITTTPEAAKKPVTGIKNTSSSKNQEARRGLYLGTMFTLGMGTVFFILGLFISRAGAVLANASYFYLAAGLLLVLFGINSIHPLREYLDPLIEKIMPARQKDESKSFFERSKEASMKIFKDSPTAGAFLLGILFTLGWAPCALALIMPAVILLLAQGVSTLSGAIMFLLFGIGHGIVIIPLATATTTSRAKMAQTFAKHGNTITKTFGAIIILLGILMMLRTQGLYLW
jgi:cytochrome c-type biogenesis protein